MSGASVAERVAGVLAETAATHEISYERRAWPSYECACGWDGASGPEEEDHDTAEYARAHVAAVQAAALAELGLTPEGDTTVEWAVRSVLDVGGEHTGHPFRSKAAANESAERLRQIWRAGDAYENRVQSVRLVRRTRTRYPDRVGEWEAVE